MQKHVLLPLILGGIFALYSPFFACTGIRLKAKNGAVIYARTMEFGQPMESEILFIPRNILFKATGPTGKDNGISWKSKYAAIGANALGLHHIIDGVNEVGLAGGLFYFPEYAQYQKVATSEVNKSLGAWELLTWILTKFSSVDEVKKALPTIKVSNAPLAQWNGAPPAHLVVHDAKGNSLVIEYVNGTLHMYDNSLGVITNSPTFDWHITNLRNYGNLTNINVKDSKVDGINLTPFGQGSGMLGLPGDFTPPSRFVRAVAYSQSAQIAKTEKEAIDTAFHILNLFDIPKGVIKDGSTGAHVTDFTQWTSLSDTKNKRFYFHTYGNRQVNMIDLLKLNLTAKDLLFWPMESQQEVVDLTRKINK